MRLVEVVFWLVLASMVLSALQAALCQLMPFVVAVGVVAGVAWLVWAVVRRRRDRW
jgi:hypothetical protein